MAVSHLYVERRARLLLAFFGGAAIGTLGGLIGLGGTELRLPLLLLFGFAALPAVIVNKAVSLVVVTSALIFRGPAVAPEAPAIIQAILAGTQPRCMSLLWFQRNPLPTDWAAQRQILARFDV